VKLEHSNQFVLDPNAEPCWRHNDYDLNTFQLEVQVSAGPGLGLGVRGAAGDHCTSNRSRVAASLSHTVTVTVTVLGFNARELRVPGSSESEHETFSPAVANAWANSESVPIILMMNCIHDPSH
jgi:hypothetical protein